MKQVLRSLCAVVVLSILAQRLPGPVIEEEKLMSRSDAVRALHFPSTPEDVARAQQRIAFEEMYGVQKDALERKKMWQGEHQSRLMIPMDAELIKLFFASIGMTSSHMQITPFLL